MVSTLRSCFVTLLVLFAGSASARDWFVRQGSNGDGTRANPFGDPTEALDKCEAGDTVHVAAGHYVGKLQKGEFEFPFDNVTMLGGYNADFTERNPWKNKTELAWDQNKNRPNQARVYSRVQNSTLDGFVIDMTELNEYTPDKGRKELPSGDGAIYFALPGVIRNNVIFNTNADAAIKAKVQSTIENNVIVNAITFGIDISQHGSYKQPVIIKNNTILFTQTYKAKGKGGYAGSAIGLRTGVAATITGNILANNDNNGLDTATDLSKVSVQNNLFFMNGWANLKTEATNSTAVDDASMDMLDELELKASDGNEVKNHGLALDKEYVALQFTRTDSEVGKVSMDDMNKLRQALGMNLQGSGGKAATGVANPYSATKIFDLLNNKNKAGAHIVSLPVARFNDAAAAAPQRTYVDSDFTTWMKAPKNDAALSLVVAIGTVSNVSLISNAGFDPKQYEGVQLYDRKGSGQWLTGFYKKGSAVARLVAANLGRYNGSGVPPRLFTVKGVSYDTGGYPRAAFLVESADEDDVAAANGAKKARPAGRDWFVRAGATGGDGSKEKPFKDPFQALEKVETGDSIHVAEGEYNGKLKKGIWKVSVPYLALYGGYDSTFSERNPWKHPTVLRTGDLKTYVSDYTLAGESDHRGVIVDGFVFDRTPTNHYTASGDLDYSNSPKMDFIWFADGEAIIRNNVFVNSTERAIRAHTGHVYDNNIIFNSHSMGMDVQRGKDETPVVITNNTFAFSWWYKFGKGDASTGYLLNVGTDVRATIDNNIFEFADNDAIRMPSEAKNISLTRNTFNHNLWSDVLNTRDNTLVDDKTFGQLKGFGFKKQEGNQVISAGLQVDAKWFDTYLSRTAYTPGKVTMDDWNQLREMLGQPVIATGGSAGDGLAPNYKWQDAMKVFPKNPKVTAGARAKDLALEYGKGGPVAAAEKHDYEETTWDASCANKNDWQKLVGKRVSLTIVVRDPDRSWGLDELSKDEYAVFSVTGPEGTEAKGLPTRFYVKKGTKAGRVLDNAKSYSRGDPEETYTVRGIAKDNRQLVIEEAEKN